VGAVTKIQVVALDEDRSIATQIDEWRAVGWHFRGFLRRGPGIWDRPQALFERDVDLVAVL
jgi:hypothetical protein